MSSHHPRTIEEGHGRVADATKITLPLFPQCLLDTAYYCLRKLAILIRTAIAAKKCLFVAGPGAYMVAYVCTTGGRPLKVLNGGGDGGSLLDLAAVRPEDLGGSNNAVQLGLKVREPAMPSRGYSMRR